MPSLKRIVRDSVDRRLDTGGSVSAGVVKALREHRKQQLVVFALIEAALVIGVAVAAYLIVGQGASAGSVRLLSGVLGLGAGGGIEVARRVWKEWSQTTLLLVLLEEASEAQVTSILDRLSKRL